ncbi:DUF930 domain-containing protein [Ancylobacter terrae]|uniref:DUF930 domain-containing protein n=1 Tax=Ancylobacter sp. sgz301288 TaxID=3342077 RepID=UPI0038588BB3
MPAAQAKTRPRTGTSKTSRATRAATPAGTAETALSDKTLMSLDPAARIEQRCNARGMGEVGRQRSDLHPDELVAYAFADTQAGPDSLKAPGAAVRSGNVWYHMSYSCQTSAEGTDIRAFSFKLGDAIPESEWAQHYLVPP